MSHNRNPTGKNQHGTLGIRCPVFIFGFCAYTQCCVVKGSDELLQFALRKYHSEGLTNNEKISARLEREYDMTLRYASASDHYFRSTNLFTNSKYTVKRRRKDLGLLSARHAAQDLTYNEKAQYVLDVLEEDPSNSWGVENVKARIAKDRLVHLSHDFVSNIMHLYAPEGFVAREPGAHRILHVPKAPIGIHERWAADGHDKLYSIGFPIWAIVDDASSKWLGAWVVPSNRVGNIVAYLFLDLVEKFGGMFLCELYPSHDNC